MSKADYHNDQKLAEEHIEDVTAPNAIPFESESDIVVDADAKGYVNHNIVIDEATNKRLRWLVHKRVLPVMMLVYMTQNFDKGALSTASIMGMQKDTGMVGQDYALATTTFWIGLIIGEFPANRLIQILPLGKYLSGSVFLWSVCLMAMAFAKTAPAMLGLRALLGFVESVVAPTNVALSVMWYKKSEQPLIIAGYQAMLGLSSILAGLYGFGFYSVQGHALPGWRYMFIMIACFSFFVSAFVGWYLPDSPTKAKCFSEEDKVLLVERVRGNDQGIKNPKWIQSQFKEALTDPFCWMLFSLTVLNTLVVGGIGTFSGLLINQAFGFDVKQSQLLGMPQGVFVSGLIIGSTYLVHRYKQTCLVLLGLVIPNLVCTIVLITVPPGPSTKGGLLVAFYFMQCYQAQNPIIFSLLSRNVAGQTKKVAGYTMAFLGWAGGNAISSQLFQSRWAPRYLPTLYIHIGLYGLFMIDIMLCRFLLVSRNKRKEAAARDQGIVENQHLKAFEDLTDRQNPEFRYSY